MVNYPQTEDYTRITEYKYLTGQEHAKTALTYEYPSAEGDPYYPIPKPENQELFKRYERARARDAGCVVRRPPRDLSLLQHGPDRRTGARHFPAYQRLHSDFRRETAHIPHHRRRSHPDTVAAPRPRPHLQRLVAQDAFWWATGIEDTFITAPWPATGRILDEYALTGHYDRWAEDIGLMASLGVQAARYGIPWHHVQPERDTWDWSFADNALSALLDRGIEPIVDLVHYGLPPWIDGAYLNPDYPDLVAEYAGRLAERFHGRIRYYTPLNEPRVTAWYCGRLGWWPPYRRGWRGFVAVMLAIARGIVTTLWRLDAVDPDIVPVHVDATDLYETRDPGLREETERRQEIVFLALDLVSGRVDRNHSLWSWLLQYGATRERSCVVSG